MLSEYPFFVYTLQLSVLNHLANTDGMDISSDGGV